MVTAAVAEMFQLADHQPAAPLFAFRALRDDCASQVFPAAAMEAESGHFRRMLTEPAAREAFSAFLEKRKPDFTKLEAGS